jgi:hypothetical protein
MPCRRVVFAALAGIAGLAFASAGLTATGSIRQTATCTDGGGAVWKVKSVWGTRYTAPHHVTRVHTYATGFTTRARAATTVDYAIKTYNGAGRLLQTLDARDRAFDFKAGTAWLERNVVNPVSAPGKARITVRVGDGNDGKGACSVTFRQPSSAALAPVTTTRPTTGPVTNPVTSPVTTPITNPVTSPVDSTSAADVFGWGPVVAGDEFNYVGSPDSTKWTVYNSAGNAGKGLRSSSQITVDGTEATITGTSDGTTGGMSAKFDHRTYGRWETRMRVSDRDPQYHPVLILRPVNDGPCDGEVDFAEASHDTTLMHFFNHYSCADLQTTAAKTIDATQWHNYAVELTAAGVVGYIDGVEWFRDAAHVPPSAMHQTIQLDWFPDSPTTRPSFMQVDWVRFYN